MSNEKSLRERIAHYIEQRGADLMAIAFELRQGGDPDSLADRVNLVGVAVIAAENALDLWSDGNVEGAKDTMAEVEGEQDKAEARRDAIRNYSGIDVSARLADFSFSSCAQCGAKARPGEPIPHCEWCKPF